MIINGDNDDNTLNGTADNDTINGLEGNDRLYGDADNDTLTANTGNDYLIGGSGADTYIFSIGDGIDIVENYDVDNSADSIQFTNVASTGVTLFQAYGTDDLTLSYTGGSVTALHFFSSDANWRINSFKFTDKTWSVADLALRHNGTDYSETLNSFDGIANTMNGLGGDDILNGKSDVDNLNGGFGNDRLYGDSGNDILRGGAGCDTLEGGSGKDSYLFSVNDGGSDVINNYDTDGSMDTVKFLDVDANTAFFYQLANTDNLAIRYSNKGDTAYISHFFSTDINWRVNNFMFTNPVTRITTTLEVSGIAERHNGTGYSDTLTAFDGMNNTMNGLDGDDVLNGGNGVDELNGGPDNDRLYGNIANDILKGETGNDTLEGGAGVDTYLFSAGDGVDDIRNYDTDNSLDTVQFTNVASTAVTTYQQFNTDNLVINYNGGLLTIDHFFGGDSNWRINNFKFSNGTNWTVTSIAQQHNGTEYSETLSAFNGIENTMNGLAGNDVLNGGDGVDRLNGGQGRDNLYGNAGNDTLNGDTENDQLNGGTGGDILNGGAGDDVLNGNEDGDTLNGGAGTDTLTGGSGNDYFDFNALSELGLNTTRDIITDFTRGQDKIDLSSIDANPYATGDQAFAWFGSGDPNSTQATAAYDMGIIQLTFRTSGLFPTYTVYEIQLTGSVPSLDASDFVL